MGFWRIRVRAAFVPAIAGGAVLAGAAFAWACTPASSMTIAPQMGPVGSKMNVSGQFNSPAPIEIRWNSVDGPIVGNSQGPSFSAAITPPAGTPEGAYSVVALQKDPNGLVMGKATGIFQISQAPSGASSSHSVATDLWGGFDGGASADFGSPAETAAASGPALWAGIGLLAFGLLASFACLVFGRTHRRSSVSSRQEA